MFITTQNEIISLMPTARWDRPSQLYGYLEEEERVALEPLLGAALYQHLCEEYKRLKGKYADITSTTITPIHKAKSDPSVPYGDVTERLDMIQAGEYREVYATAADGDVDVPIIDMQTVRLIRICQQIEWYKMLSHKAGLLTVSFNEGGGMNMVSADGYEPADEKRMERVVKDAYMSAGRAIDSLLLFLEADAKSNKLFVDLWKEADAFFLHKDLLFQTARVLNEYLDIKGERMAYVALVRDIRFCQNTYIKPRIGAKLLKEVVDYANGAPTFFPIPEDSSSDVGSSSSDDDEVQESDDITPQSDEAQRTRDAYEELLTLLRTALAFYVESRRTELSPAKEKLARRDSMTDAQQAMAAACAYVEENLEALGDAAVCTPIYENVHAREEQAAKELANRCAAAECVRRASMEQNRRKMFTGFPATHRTPERR